eukprot:808275-Pyramimonas_sp.AAC.1
MRRKGQFKEVGALENAGSSWTAQRTVLAGYVCPRCGGATEDLPHRFYECQKNNGIDHDWTCRAQDQERKS